MELAAGVEAVVVAVALALVAVLVVAVLVVAEAAHLQNKRLVFG